MIDGLVVVVAPWTPGWGGGIPLLEVVIHWEPVVDKFCRECASRDRESVKGTTMGEPVDIFTGVVGPVVFSSVVVSEILGTVRTAERRGYAATDRDTPDL